MIVDEPITITLPLDMSRRFRIKIAENGYKDTLDVLEDGLDALDPDPQEMSGAEIEVWLRDEIVPYCVELDQDPSKLRTLEQVDTALAAEFARDNVRG